MRTLRSSLAGTVIAALLGGSGGVVVAQEDAEEYLGVTATVIQEFVGHDPCIWTASDPRLPDTLAHDWVGGAEVEGAEGFSAGFTWMNARVGASTISRSPRTARPG